MAYVRGARRHPSVRLTITPEMEAQIERDITAAKAPRITDSMAGIKQAPTSERRAPCGTQQGYWGHARRKEPQCSPCLAANRVYRDANGSDRKKVVA